MTDQRPASTLIFVAFIVFVDMVGMGLIIPVMPALLESMTGAGEEATAQIGGWLLFAYAIMQFIFAPIVGGISDRYGRRPVLLVMLFLLGIDYVIMALAPDLWWLFAGRLLSGIMGASWTAANSCVADIVSPEERGKYFGILGGAGASGFIFGPALGGMLGEISVRLPFFAAAVLAIGGSIVGYFILRETLPKDRQRSFSCARANPLGTLIQMAKTPVVIGFITVIFFMQLASQSTFTVWAYFNRFQWGWSEFELGLSVALYGLLLALVQGVLTGKVVTRFGAKRTSLYGLLLGMPSFLIFAFASAPWMMIVGIFVGCLSGMAFPALQQMMSERISEDAQGELQGAIASAISVTSIFGPVVMTTTFGHFADGEGVFFPGAPFALSAAIGVAAILVLAWNLRRVKET
ncbi:MAG: TCR/Tet family MFS transporter [Erythrobacter sp.]|uniref:TCR/Tet family MFS transporter n=1 Tax=Erythrobacter sp. TaxID=1042 RepID=UPI003264326C